MSLPDFSDFRVDNPPAFPLAGHSNGLPGEDHQSTPSLPGMCLRDYFAAAALTGLLAGNPTAACSDPSAGVVTVAYHYAAMMLLERRQREIKDTIAEIRRDLSQWTTMRNHLVTTEEESDDDGTTVSQYDELIGKAKHKLASLEAVLTVERATAE